MDAEKANLRGRPDGPAAGGVAVGLLRLGSTPSRRADAGAAAPGGADRQDHHLPRRVRPGVRVTADPGRPARGRRAGVGQDGRQTDAASGIVGISPRGFVPVTTLAGPDPQPVPDLVGRRFDPGQLNRVWTSDITYLATGEGWLYLCAIRDGCSRRVVGWAIEDHLRTDLVEAALRRAVTLRGELPAQVIFHADRGTQYTSAQIADACADLPVLRSMGRTGVCWDNAAAESFWSTLKTEFYNRHHWPTKAEAKQAVGAWIEERYNRKRRHSAIGMISPVRFEELHTQTAQAA